MIFQDQYDLVSIYDSFDTPLTIYNTAEILENQYAPVYAVNLDMAGPEGYCGRYDNDQLISLYGGKGKNVQLSNILIFNYN